MKAEMEMGGINSQTRRKKTAYYKNKLSFSLFLYKMLLYEVKPVFGGERKVLVFAPNDC